VLEPESTRKMFEEEKQRRKEKENEKAWVVCFLSRI
jgi:hypothetical protein